MPLKFIGLLAVTVLLCIACAPKTYFSNHYLQAHHTEVQLQLSNDSLLIENVYCRDFQGSSMNPVLFSGNMVCMKPFNMSIDRLKQGNIIHFLYNESGEEIEVMHRIVAVQQDFVITQGDNMPKSRQEKVFLKNIRGILVSVVYV